MIETMPRRIKLAIAAKTAGVFIAFVMAAFPLTEVLSEPLTEASEQIDFADGLFIRKMYKMALDEYEKFYAGFPQHQETHRSHFMSAECLFRMKEHGHSIERYRDYIKRFPDAPDVPVARLHMGISLIELKEYKQTLEALRPLLDKPPPDILQTVYYYAGLAETAMDNKEAGAKYFQLSVDGQGDSSYAALAAYRRGSLYLESGDYAKAITLFEKCAQTTGDPELRLTAFFGKAQAQLEDKRYKKAAKGFTGLVEDNEGAAEIRQKALVNALQALYYANEFDQAVEIYRKYGPILTDAAPMAAAARITAKAYVGLKLFGDGYTLLDGVLTNPGLTDAQRADIVLEKIDMLILEGRFPQAQDLIDAHESYAGEPRYIFLRAENYFYQKEFGRAREWYAKVIGLGPDTLFYRDALYGMAHGTLKEGGHKEARDLFAQFADAFADDGRGPDALYTVIVLGADEPGRGDYAITRCGIFLKRYPDHPKCESVYFLMGRFNTDRQEYAEAITAYEEFKKRYPESARIDEADFMIGYNYQLSGDTKKANEYYSRVRKDTPEARFYYLAQKNMAQNYLAQGSDDEAVRALDNLMVKYHDNDLNADAYFWVARKYSEKGKHNDSIRVLAMAKDRKDIGVRMSEFLYLIAEAYRGAGDYDRASAEYTRCVSGDSGDELYKGPALLGLGLTFDSKDDLDRAQGYFEQAISFNPEDNTVAMRARFHLANLFFRKKEFEQAAKVFMMVTILYDDNKFVPEALKRAAESFSQAGKLKEARATYEEFIGKYPDHLLVPEAKKALNRIKDEDK